MTSCVDLAAIDDLFDQACCAQSGYYSSYRSSLGGVCPGSAYQVSGLQCSCIPPNSLNRSADQCPVSDAMTGAVHLPPGYYMDSTLRAADDSYLLHYAANEQGVQVLANAFGQVQNSVFQCSALPQCRVSCPAHSASVVSHSIHLLGVVRGAERGAAAERHAALLLHGGVVRQRLPAADLHRRHRVSAHEHLQASRAAYASAAVW